MKHKILNLISIFLIISFAWQQTACGDCLRPLAAGEDVTDQAKTILEARLGVGTAAYIWATSLMDRYKIIVVNRNVSSEDAIGNSNVPRRIYRENMVSALEFEYNDAGYPVGIKNCMIFWAGPVTPERFNMFMHELTEIETVEKIMSVNKRRNRISKENFQRLANLLFTEWLTDLLLCKRAKAYRFTRQEFLKSCQRSFNWGVIIARKNSHNPIRDILAGTSLEREFVAYFDIFTEGIARPVIFMTKHFMGTVDVPPELLARAIGTFLITIDTSFPNHPMVLKDTAFKNAMMRAPEPAEPPRYTLNTALAFI